MNSNQLESLRSLSDWMKDAASADEAVSPHVIAERLDSAIEEVEELLNDHDVKLRAVEDFIGWLDAAASHSEPVFAKGKVSAKVAASRLRSILNMETSYAEECTSQVK